MTVAECLKKAEAYLVDRGVPEAQANAEFLMAEMLSVGRLSAVAQGGRALTAKETHQYLDMIKWRGKRIPLAYIDKMHLSRPLPLLRGITVNERS